MRGKKDFCIQSVGFWSVKAHGCSTCVSPGWQGKPLLGRVGSLQTPWVGFLGMWNVLSVERFVPLVGSSYSGACSEYAFVRNVSGCLIRQMLPGWVRCSGTMRNTSILFLTFLMERGSKVIWFLRNWTMIFECRGQGKENQSFSPVECRRGPSGWTLDLLDRVSWRSQPEGPWTRMCTQWDKGTLSTQGWASSNPTTPVDLRDS